jgi:outer membrane protein OmpA-like peptidoglycan-associated protein
LNVGVFRPGRQRAGAVRAGLGTGRRAVRNALIEGHTDSIGSEAYNPALSDRRAKSVFDYLTSRGVDPARLSSIGKGETMPIADNSTAEGRQQNRRVMLIRTDTGM